MSIREVIKVQIEECERCVAVARKALKVVDGNRTKVMGAMEIVEALEWRLKQLNESLV